MYYIYTRIIEAFDVCLATLDNKEYEKLRFFLNYYREKYVSLRDKKKTIQKKLF